MTARTRSEALVETVLGPIPANDLGVTLPHEHVVIDFSALWVPPPGMGGLDVALGRYDPTLRGLVNHDPNFVLDAIGNPLAHTIVPELEAYRAAGGSSLVELTPIGVGRHPHVLAAMARLTGLNIVMSTAFYIEPFHPPFLFRAREKDIAELFVEELTVGVAGTGIRAGIIGEIGTGSPPTPDELKVVRAAAEAHHETGVSINLHRTSYPGPNEVLGPLDLLLDLGVPPDRIVVSHCDERPEPELALEVARRGAYVEMDTWGMEMWATRWVFGNEEIPAASDRDRLEMLAELIHRGYLRQILLSQDVCNKAQLASQGGYGYAHLLRSVRDRLRVLGVSESEQRILFQENPQRMLTPASPAS